MQKPLKNRVHLGGYREFQSDIILHQPGAIFDSEIQNCKKIGKKEIFIFVLKNIN